ncbi:MAG: hypothetical protein HGB10_02285 [Coriobacteriia bacterium]|nr:hypothetical protein [Coriobacteriia bacterium]
MKRTLIRALVLASALALLGASVAWGGVAFPNDWFAMRPLLRNGVGDLGEYAYKTGDFAGSRLVVGRTDIAGRVVRAYDLRTSTVTDLGQGLTSARNPQAAGSWAFYPGENAGTWGLYRQAFGTLAGEPVTVTANAESCSIDDETGKLAVLINADPFTDDSQRVWVASVTQPTALTRLNSIDKWQYKPVANDGYVTYMQDADVDLGQDTFDLMLTSQTNPADTSIIATGVMPAWNNDQAGQDFDGDLFAWQHDDPIANKHVIQYRNVSDGTTGTIAVTGFAYDPKVDGTKVYFRSGSPGSDTILMFDTRLGTSYIVAVGSAMDLLSAQDGRVLFSMSNGTSSATLMEATAAEPVLSITAPSSVAYQAQPTISGTLTDAGDPIQTAEVTVQRSTDGIHWVGVSSEFTDSLGRWSTPAPALSTTSKYRARYSGMRVPSDPDYTMHLSTVSDVVVVAARPRIGTPSKPRTVVHNRTYTVQGTISPSQAAQHASGKVIAYKRTNGHWIARRSFTASFSAGKYSARMKLPSSGSWRYRLKFDRSDTNASAYGPYRTVTAR